MGSVTYRREEEGWGWCGVGLDERFKLIWWGLRQVPWTVFHGIRTRANTLTEIILCMRAPSGAHLMVHLSGPSKPPFYLDMSHEVLIDPNGLDRWIHFCTSSSNGLNLWALDDSVRISAWG